MTARDLVRDLVAEVERLRTDLARMTERAEGAEVAWQDAETERDAARRQLRDLQRVYEHDTDETVRAEDRAVIYRVQALHSQGACSCGYEHVRLHIGPDCEPMCNECGPGEWPCATRRALAGEVSDV